MTATDEDFVIIGHYKTKPDRYQQSSDFYENELEFARYSWSPEVGDQKPSIFEENLKVLTQSIQSSCAINESEEVASEIIRKITKVNDKKIKKSLFHVK